ncbi:MAG: GntR family transcriptional regulator [Rhizomicrobium sp.]
MAQKRVPAQPSGLDEWPPQLAKARLYGQLVVDIIVGRLRPGEKLDERTLAKRYGGGVAGIREALTRLALEGLVQRRPRVGTLVAPLDLVEARDAFAARALVETACAGLAARHASPGDIAAISGSLKDGESAIARNDVRALAIMDEAFHVAVAQASHNRVLAKLVVSLHRQTARFWLHAMGKPSLKENRRALARHRELAAGIAAHDEGRAQTAMRKVFGDFPADIKRAWEAP